MGIIKAGRVVVLLQGRYAGKKAVVVKAYETGDNGDRKFSHAIVAGIERGPRKITKAMDDAKVAKRSLMKPFIKHVNYTHMMPTRYQCFDDKKEDGGALKKIVDDAVKSKASFTSKEVRGAVRKLFTEKYAGQATAKDNDKKATGVSYFYSKLRF
jgi:large subunit ribosomal protein L27e